MLVVWCAALVIGPLVGGSLSHPAEKIPGLFGGMGVLKDRVCPGRCELEREQG